MTTSRRRLPLEHSILVTATLCLLAGGAVMVYSASAPVALSGGGSGTGTLIRFALYAAAGLVALQVAARVGLATVRRLTGPLLGVAFLLLLAVRLPGLGHGTNGAQRWLGLGPLEFEPAELMKLALILYAAHVFASGRPGVRSAATACRRLGLVAGCGCALVATQPDIGTTVVIALTLTAVVLVAGVPVRLLAVAGVVGAAALAVFALTNPYALARLTSFTNPAAHARTSGYQAWQSQIAIGSGGVFGRGPGQSVQKDFWLPEAPTDFILAVIGEELGFAGIASLLFLYGLIAYAGMRAARRANGIYATLVAVGVTSLILFQAALNVFAVLGIAPVTGVPLPFVSYGASNLLVLLAGMGLVLNVAAGGGADIRAVRSSTRARKPRRSADDRARARRDRSRRHSRARGAGAGGR